MELNYFNRTGYVSIENDRGEWVNFGGNSDALDFKFSGEKIGRVYTWFNVSILGLSSDTINALTVWNPAKSINRKRRIRVFAGYEGDGRTNPIFEGIVFEAMPTNPPEMWMNFKCLHFDDIGDEKRSIEFRRMRRNEIIAELAKPFGLKTSWEDKNISGDDTGKFIEESFSFSGSYMAAIDYFSERFRVRCFEENGILRVVGMRPWLSQPPEDAVVVDTGHGMLGLGNVTIAGAKIRKRLDDTAPMMGWVYLKSSIIPKANGYYCVIKKKHVGHFRGNEWETELECIRQGASV